MHDQAESEEGMTKHEARERIAQIREHIPEDGTEDDLADREALDMAVLALYMVTL